MRGWSGSTELERLRDRYRRTLEVAPSAASRLVDPGVVYEVSRQDDDSARTGLFELFVGQEVAPGSEVAVELCLKRIPGGRHAVFGLRGEEGESDWLGWVAGEWLPRSPYELAGRYVIERRRCGPLSDAEVEILVPVRLRSASGA